MTKKKKRTLPEVEAAIDRVETFVAALTHACGQDWDDRAVKEAVWEWAESLLPNMIKAKLMHELGFRVAPTGDDDEEEEEEEADTG